MSQPNDIISVQIVNRVSVSVVVKAQTGSQSKAEWRRSAFYNDIDKVIARMILAELM